MILNFWNNSIKGGLEYPNNLCRTLQTILIYRMIHLLQSLITHNDEMFNSLHSFVNKSGREILQNSSQQGLRPFLSSFSLSFTPRFSTKSVLNRGY